MSEPLELEPETPTDAPKKERKKFAPIRARGGGGAKPLTEEERAEFHNALTAAEGMVSVAAQKVGVDRDTVIWWIKNDPLLNAQWSKSLEMFDAIDTLDRPPSPITNDVMITDDDIRRAEALTEQDKKLQKGWDTLGITDPDELAMIENFETFTHGAIIRTVDATHGGLLAVFVKASTQFRKLTQELEEPDITAQRKKEIYPFWFKTGELIRKVAADTTRAAHIRAMIEEKAKELGQQVGGQHQEGAGKRQRAGWNTPIDVTPNGKTDKK
jgi:hypothetical protein